LPAWRAAKRWQQRKGSELEAVEAAYWKREASTLAGSDQNNAFVAEKKENVEYRTTNLARRG
jgi:hypothetical protein